MPLHMDYQTLTRWFNGGLNNKKTIFYKLREHIAAYHKTWSQHCQEKQTMLTRGCRD